MSYELAFVADALKEWGKLDRPIREQFKAKLAERLENPRIPAAKLSGHPDRYKIKLRSVGYRLFYEVRDREIVIVVVAVRRRERSAVYKSAASPVVATVKKPDPSPYALDDLNAPKQRYLGLRL